MYSIKTLKINKKIIIILALLFILAALLLMFRQDVSGIIKQPNCYFGGGRWRYMGCTYGDECVDPSMCDEKTIINGIEVPCARLCLPAMTWACDCGENECWNGSKCVQQCERGVACNDE